MRTPATISELGGGRTAFIKNSAEVGIGDRRGHTPFLTASAMIVKKITSYTPPRIQAEILSQYKGLELADPKLCADTSILLGADVYARILTGGLRRINDDLPIAQETAFGWILSGPVQGASPSKLVSSLHCNVLESLDNAIRKFWEIEAVPIIAHKTLEEAECEEHFQRTVTRNEEGRFVVRLPFKKPHAEQALGDSLRIALSALTRLRRKLDPNTALLQSCSDFLLEYESLNHMTRLRSIDSSRTYIPHRAVVREESVTTKLRVVFNASSASAGGSSLNEILHVGPKLQRDITAILTNWRLYQYVMVADIEKMFRQILVAPEDRKFQCIVWRSPEDERLTAFELNTVTYGTACAPYLSMRTLLELARQDGSKYPLAVPVMENDVYVDDVFLSAPDKTRLEELRVQ
ncbi:uncharacterized protein LOC108627460, partial [Ceratina calcarata]|uniref:Uncharacterized protein LOC108627460 n=1 Tax=Ceratina calcarata TaxID=156304 RepID=A0AAJ7N9G7_9HYME